MLIADIRTFLVRTVLLGSTFLLVGCFGSSVPKEHNRLALVTVPDTHSSASEAPLPKQSPFHLAVLDELNDGRNLYLLGQVTSEVPWKLDRVVVRLTGLNAGEEIKTVDLPLQQLRAERAKGVVGGIDTLQPGEKVDFSLHLPAKGITDYQLELLWGQEAPIPQAIAKSNGAEGPGVIELRNLVVESNKINCPGKSCGVAYRLKGELFNSGGGVVRAAALGVGFVPRKPGRALDLSTLVPQNEEEVEVGELNLTPGESRALNLLFDRVLSEMEATTYRPAVRVLSVNGERVLDE